METMNAILERRSVRKYTDEPISDADLDAILTAALSAPSGLNLQPWYFVAVKSDEEREVLSNIMESVSVKISKELEDRFASHPEIVAETRHFIRTLGNAPVTLLAFLMRDDYADKETAMVSVAAAVENALIAARDLGIGSCWLTAPNQTGFGDQIRDHFAPGKGALVATVSLGHTENWPKAVARRKDRFAIV